MSNKLTSLSEDKYAEFKKPEPVPVFDLSQYIAIQKLNPKFKIGILGDCPQNFSGYKKGDFVLYELYTIDEVYGMYPAKMIENHIKHCTVQKPNPRFFTGESNIKTTSTCVGFPIQYIDLNLTLTEYGAICAGMKQ